MALVFAPMQGVAQAHACGQMSASVQGAAQDGMPAVETPHAAGMEAIVAFAPAMDGHDCSGQGIVSASETHVSMPVADESATSGGEPASMPCCGPDACMQMCAIVAILPEVLEFSSVLPLEHEVRMPSFLKTMNLDVDVPPPRAEAA